MDFEVRIGDVFFTGNRTLEGFPVDILDRELGNPDLLASENRYDPRLDSAIPEYMSIMST